MEKTFWNRVNNKELLEQVGDGKEVIWINENQEKTAYKGHLGMRF